MTGFDAIVLAGGAASRLGGSDKPMQQVAGRPLLAHVLQAVAQARTRVVVGPVRDGIGGVVWRIEQPPGGGPVAALAAALPVITADVVLVLAGDLPRIASAVVPLLNALGLDPLGTAEFGSCADMANRPQVDAAVLQTQGRINYLAAAWRREALVAAVGAVGDPNGAAVRALLARRPAIVVDDPEGWGRDVDTWADLAAVRAERA